MAAVASAIDWKACCPVSDSFSSQDAPMTPQWKSIYLISQWHKAPTHQPIRNMASSAYARLANICLFCAVSSEVRLDMVPHLCKAADNVWIYLFHSFSSID